MTTRRWGVDAYIWIDEVTVHFKEVNVEQVDSDSINRWGIRQATFQDKNVLDWKQGHAIAKGIIAASAKATKRATIEPQMNPAIQLNDIFTVDLLGKKVDMVVKRRKVTINKKTGIKMKLEVGDKKPDISGLINAFKIVQDTQSGGGSGYKLSESWSDNRCRELCESECEESCLTDLDQTDTKILSDLGITRQNPCTDSCQTATEL